MINLDKPYFSDVKEMKRKKDVEGLIQILRHEDELRREAAAMVLGEIGDRNAANDLIKSSLNDTEIVRRTAFRALVKIADDALFASMKVTKSPTYLCTVDRPPERIEWSANCCICFGPAQVAKETLCRGLGPRIQAGLTYDRYLTVTRVTRVPYCQSCLRKTKKRFFGEKEGVEIELVAKSTEKIDEQMKIVQTRVKFRNPLYAKKFLEINS